MIGSWSDKYGRKPFLIIAFSTASLPLLVILLHLQFGLSMLFYFPAQVRELTSLLLLFTLSSMSHLLVPKWYVIRVFVVMKYAGHTVCWSYSMLFGKTRFNIKLHHEHALCVHLSTVLGQYLSVHELSTVQCHDTCQPVLLFAAGICRMSKLQPCAESSITVAMPQTQYYFCSSSLSHVLPACDNFTASDQPACCCSALPKHA